MIILCFNVNSNVVSMTEFTFLFMKNLDESKYMITMYTPGKKNEV